MKSIFLAAITIIAGIAFGLFLFFKPELSIQIQKRFYEKINWLIEPVSLVKEIRNTKIMGLVLTVACLSGLIYFLVKISFLTYL